MYLMSRRRIATRTVTFYTLFALTAAAGVNVALLGQAEAQRGMHSGTHDHHHEGASKPLAAAGKRRTIAGAHHAGHGPSGADTPAVSEMKAAHATMMQAMTTPYTGDPDADFRLQMIPHHQGAIDMARVAMRRAKNPWTRQLAESVIVEQQREIAEMQAWLTQHGIAAPSVSGPRHTITASSYRQHDEEAGTRGEALGKSWAPGGGVPTAR